MGDGANRPADAAPTTWRMRRGAALLGNAGGFVPLPSEYLAMHRHMLVCKIARVHVCVRRTRKSCTERNATKEDSMVRPPRVAEYVQEQIFLHRHEPPTIYQVIQFTPP